MYHVIYAITGKCEDKARSVDENTSRFIKRYIRTRNYYSLDEIRESDYEAFVVGSDQVWRKQYFEGTSSDKYEDAFLSFLGGWNVRRIAYAASFGTDKWEADEPTTDRCRLLAKRFNAISVREASGVKMCAEYLDCKAQWVVDPTMLLRREDYEQLIARADTCPPTGNLLTYILDENDTSNEYIEKIAKERGFIPFKANGKPENSDAPLPERIQPSVEQWLRGFRDAELVVTDSFHACAFSIIFNTPFIVLINKHRGSERIKSLLQSVGQEYRIASEMSDISGKALTSPMWILVHYVKNLIRF